ncbi:hypothetical protein ACOMHN_038823 [Nucella lapillus]
MAVDAQVRCLVSEQYLDGWSYDDDIEPPSSPPLDCDYEPQTNSEDTVSGSKEKRHHSSMDSGGDKAEPVDKKKKFSMSFSSKGGGSSKTEGPPTPPIGPESRSMPGPAKKMEMPSVFSSTKLKPIPIKMNLASQTKPKAKEKEVPASSSVKKSFALAQAFGDDSDESEEEMPAEARMRMRNIGRETPTAAGPNSFGKGNLGFCNRQKIIEKELQKTDENK